MSYQTDADQRGESLAIVNGSTPTQQKYKQSVDCDGGSKLIRRSGDSAAEGFLYYTRCSDHARTTVMSSNKTQVILVRIVIWKFTPTHTGFDFPDFWISREI